MNWINCFGGYGYEPRGVEGDDPPTMHQLMAAALDAVLGQIRQIQSDARSRGLTHRPRWPMIVLRTPKGWTGPERLNGKPVEGFWRSHQVPLAQLATKPAHLKQLEQWMKSYRPQELFDDSGRLRPELQAWAPAGERRMSANPHANGGVLLRNLRLPDFRDYAVDVPEPGEVTDESTRALGEFLRDVLKLARDTRNVRLFGPDETSSNRLSAVFQASDKVFLGEFSAVGLLLRDAVWRLATVPLSLLAVTMTRQDGADLPRVSPLSSSVGRQLERLSTRS